MSAQRTPKHRVGELRPSQLLMMYGIGSVVDLPNLSVMVMGLEDWEITQASEIGEERLRLAVQSALGTQVKRLLAPPLAPEASTWGDIAFGDAVSVGVPVATFPRWMVCPYCRLLAPLDSGLFLLKADHFRPDRTRYVHHNCNKPGQPPTVLPARFLVACTHGHLDDFPWIYFVHGGQTDCQARLRLRELGVSGEAADVQVSCEACGMQRRMADAFGPDARGWLPLCRGRRPQLRDFEDAGCAEQMRTILLGASNSWFPVTLSALSVPVGVDQLGQLVAAHWHVLENLVNQQNVELLRTLGQLAQFAAYGDEEVWAAIERKRAGTNDAGALPVRLKAPEWRLLSGQEPFASTSDFRLSEAPVPRGYEALLSRVVLVERLRRVSALVGFTRIISPGDYGEVGELPNEVIARLARHDPTWVPAAEVRGEGLFLQFDEPAIQAWLRRGEAMARHERAFRDAHRRWRRQRHLEPADAHFPGLRYVLMHSFAHALMRQLALESGYTAASLSERIYALAPSDDDGPMAGILIYTAAPDSEGTLGGLVTLGAPAQLGRHLDAALAHMRWCASDPLCAEHVPLTPAGALHGAACHACLFAPETACERGNKYLDRAVLVPTVECADLAFFAGK
ncbi:MAG TPA: DUF1998 domain-containing protein [Ktedonobacterales bacterium]